MTVEDEQHSRNAVRLIWRQDQQGVWIGSLALAGTQTAFDGEYRIVPFGIDAAWIEGIRKEWGVDPVAFTQACREWLEQHAKGIS